MQSAGTVSGWLSSHAMMLIIVITSHISVEEFIINFLTNFIEDGIG